jgi:hypothetical protein
MIKLNTRSVTVLTDDEVALVSGGFRSDPTSWGCGSNICGSGICGSDVCQSFGCDSLGCDSYGCHSLGCNSNGCESDGCGSLGVCLTEGCDG